MTSSKMDRLLRIELYARQRRLLNLDIGRESVCFPGDLLKVNPNLLNGRPADRNRVGVGLDPIPSIVPIRQHGTRGRTGEEPSLRHDGASHQIKTRPGPI